MRTQVREPPLGEAGARSPRAFRAPAPRIASPAVTRTVEAVAGEDWDGLLAALGVSDVYYSRGFVESSALLAGGRPVLLHLPGDAGAVVFAGPAARRSGRRGHAVRLRRPAGGRRTRRRRGVRGGLPGLVRAAGVVSSFVVFHPLFANHASAASEGFRRTALADTVAWRLDGDLEAGMHAHHRRQVRRARREGLDDERAPRPRRPRRFVALYEPDDVHGSTQRTFYRFGDEYWARLAALARVRIDVRRDEELHACVLGLGRAPWLHYHLGGVGGRRPPAGREPPRAPHPRPLGAGERLRAAAPRRRRRRACRRPAHLQGALRSRESGARAHREGGARRHRVRGADRRDTIDWDGFFPAYRRR